MLLYLLILLFLKISPSLGTRAICPKGFHPSANKNFCHAVQRGVAMNYYNAERRCDSQSATLITNYEEMVEAAVWTQNAKIFHSKLVIFWMDTNLSQYDENDNRCFSFFSPSNTIKTTTCNTTFFVMCRRDAKRQDTQAISLSKQLMNRRPGEARRTVAKGWKDALLLRTTWKPGKNAWKPGKNAPVVRIGDRKVGKKFERIDGSVVNRMAGRRSPFGGHLPHRNMGFLHLRMT